MSNFVRMPDGSIANISHIVRVSAVAEISSNGDELPQMSADTSLDDKIRHSFKVHFVDGTFLTFDFLTRSKAVRSFSDIEAQAGHCFLRVAN